MLKNTISHKKLAVVVGSGTLPFEVIKGIKKLQIEHVIVKFEGVEYNSYEGSNIIEAIEVSRLPALVCSRSR